MIVKSKYKVISKSKVNQSYNKGYTYTQYLWMFMLALGFGLIVGFVWAVRQ